MIRCVLAALVPLLLAASASGALPIDARNRAIEVELEMARKKEIYLVFDLDARKVEVRSRGLVLKTFAIHDVRLWGARPAIEPLTLKARKAMAAPQRERIAPESKSDKDVEIRQAPPPGQDTFDIKALELVDMPEAYALILDKDISIRVRPYGTGLISGVRGLGRSLWAFVRDSLASALLAMRGRHYGTVEIALTPEDARALYWAFLDGARCLVLAPTPRESIEKSGRSVPPSPMSAGRAFLDNGASI